MAEYIERKAILREIERREALMVGDKLVSVNAMKSFIKNRPAADVAPVRHGRWEWDTEDIYRCSNCAEKSHVKEVMGHPEWDYCPNCGAKMDGGYNNISMA